MWLILNNVVPSKSSKWVSFKALSDATDKFSTIAGKKLEMGDIESIWEAWLLLTLLMIFATAQARAITSADYMVPCSDD
jgi:hypothetical protein